MGCRTLLVFLRLSELSKFSGDYFETLDAIED